MGYNAITMPHYTDTYRIKCADFSEIRLPLITISKNNFSDIHMSQGPECMGFPSLFYYGCSLFIYFCCDFQLQSRMKMCQEAGRENSGVSFQPMKSQHSLSVAFQKKISVLSEKEIIYCELIYWQSCSTLNQQIIGKYFLYTNTLDEN